MKHKSSREFFAYWDKKRGTARAPDRMDIDPEAVRGLLGDIFVLSYDATAGHPFRVAGTRVCALLGRDVKDESFLALFRPDARREVEEIISTVAEEMQGVVAGLAATSQEGSAVLLELLLLPFNARPHAPISLTGVLAPFESTPCALGDLELRSWRCLRDQPERLAPRSIRKLAIARGFVVYEGFR